VPFAAYAAHRPPPAGNDVSSPAPVRSLHARVEQVRMIFREINKTRPGEGEQRAVNS
jgi:hypothetical protein